MFGGGGRASSESFWPDPPQVIPARRLIGKSKVHGFVKVVPPFVKKPNFAKSKAAAVVKVVDVKAQSAANAKAPGTRTTTATPSKSSSTSSTSTSRPRSSAAADSGGSLLDALYPDPPRPKPKAESGTKPQCQTRMPRGTAGTWRGRRPPKTPEKLKAWLARKAAWEARHSTPKP